MSQRRTLSARTGLLASGLLALFAACAPAAPGRPEGQDEVSVTVGAALSKDVPIVIRVIGTVEAFSTVSVKAQVGGELRQVSFEEGQDVRKGEVLFESDPRPYAAALEQARAQLDRDRAQLKNARSDAERYAGLAEKDYVTASEYDRILTSAAALEATVLSDEAAVKSAALQLEYCTIRSPLQGRTGRLMVHRGNVGKANADTPLVVIEQMDPIYVSFSVPERNLAGIRSRQAEGALAVQAVVPDSGGRAVTGRLTFLDSTVDSRTGTVLLKATFPNPERILWPGQYVNVELTLATKTGAVVVPTEAIQTGQEGPYVFVVRPDSTVESRPVVPGETLEHETVIEKGVSAGEKVVTDGHLRLVPGAKVAPKGGREGGAEGTP